MFVKGSTAIEGLSESVKANPGKGSFDFVDISLPDSDNMLLNSKTMMRRKGECDAHDGSVDGASGKGEQGNLGLVVAAVAGNHDRETKA